MERIRFQDVRTGHEAGQRIDPVQSLQLSRQARIDVRHSQWAQWDSSCNCWSRQRLTLGTVRLRQGGWICAEVLGAGTVPNLVGRQHVRTRMRETGRPALRASDQVGGVAIAFRGAGR